MRIQIGSKNVSFPELLNEFMILKVFSDVTLASDDGIRLRAHKFSPLFKCPHKSDFNLQCCNNENKGIQLTDIVVT